MDVLTCPTLKLLTTPGTFKHVLCIYDYIVRSAFDVTSFFITIGLVENLSSVRIEKSFWVGVTCLTTCRLNKQEERDVIQQFSP